MKVPFRYIFVLWMACLLLPTNSGVASEAERPRVAVVLSGGGAKGVAHISVLKVIEELGIPVDYVVGTSMGSIIGGLYAIGYSPEQLDSIVRAQDWMWLLSDKPKRNYRTLTEKEDETRFILSVPLARDGQKFESLVKGQNISDMFAALTVGYHDSIDFRNLPIPFACVATNITDGSEVILDKGVLAESMRASMAIPGVFSPVRKGKKVLVDGGLVNNFPVDVARRMGADIVIGVDVQQGMSEDSEVNNLTDILSKVIDIACKNKLEENLRDADAYIKVNVDGYSAASFSSAAIDSLIFRGQQAADECRGRLQEIKGRILAPVLSSKPSGTVPYPLLQKEIEVNGIYFEGLDSRDRKRVINKCRLHENTAISYKQIEQALAILRTELNYSEVSFRLFEEREGYKLVFRLAKKNATTFNVGVRFDTEEVASLLLGSSIYLHTSIPSTLLVMGRLGKQYMASLEYALQPSLMRNISLKYTFRYHDIDFYNEGNKMCNTTYNHHAFELGYSNVWLRNFRYRIGIAYELYHDTDILYKEGNRPFAQGELTDNTLSYSLQVDYNTQDNALFPQRGVKFTATGAFYTDNFVQYRDHSPFYTLSASISSAHILGRRLTLLPSAAIRKVEGKDIPRVYRNALGGETASRYLMQQLPFVGVGHTEFVNDALVIAGLKLRYRLMGKHYLSCVGSVGSNTDKLGDFGKGKILYGAGLNYAFDSKFGPLELTVGYSNLAENFYCFGNIGFYF